MALNSNFQKAPLAELEGTAEEEVGGAPYNFTSLKYPLNVDHELFYGHYINFYINVHKLSAFYKNLTYTGAPSIYAPTNAPGVGGTTDPDSSSWGAMAQSVFYQRVTQAISLYIPDTVQTSQSIGWEDSSLLELGKKFASAGRTAGELIDPKSELKQAAKKAVQTTSKVIDIVGKVTGGVGGVFGTAWNPQLLVIFKGITNRHFTYEFYFSPRNKSEADYVRKIIKAFRYHAHPDVNYGMGAFFIAPSTFDIEFIHKGTRNKNIHMIKTCVLKDYSIDYAPAGWSTHHDGMPIQTRLMLNFMETDILTNKDIEAGY